MMTLRKQKKSIVKQINKAASLVVFSALFISLTSNYWYSSYQTQKTYEKQLSVRLRLLSSSLENPLWSLDYSTIALMGDAYMAGSDMASLTIYSLPEEIILYEQRTRTSSETIHGQRDIKHNDDVIGRVEIGLSSEAHDAAQVNHMQFSLLLAFFLLLPMVFIIRKIFREQIEIPLKVLGGWTDMLAQGDYRAESPSVSQLELDDFVIKFDNMSKVVQEREQFLQDSERRFRGLFENSDVSIWNEDLSGVYLQLEELRQHGVTDLRAHFKEKPQLPGELAKQVRVVQVNAATLKLFGASSTEEIKFEIEKTFGPDAIETFIDELCAIWEKQGFFRAETTFRALNGNLIHAIISFHIPNDREGFSSVPINIVDISEQKKTEHELLEYKGRLELLVEEKTRDLVAAQSELLQKERLATLGRLTATVSHELLNPLGTVQLSLNTISELLKQHEQGLVQNSIALAERNISRCVGIVDELNSFTRVKPLQLETTNVKEWTSGICSEQLLPDHIELRLEIEESCCVPLDQDKMRQVLINLITNSIHAIDKKGTDRGLIEICATCRKGQVEIDVIDNGVGIFEEHLEKIFEPLFSTKDFGVGLGMAIVKNIVAQHQGEIRIESNRGVGTTVSIRLPA